MLPSQALTNDPKHELEGVLSPTFVVSLGLQFKNITALKSEGNKHLEYF